MGKGKITTDDVKKLAKLANLNISKEELEKYPSQLSESIKYVENLNEVDTSGVPDTFFTTKATNVMQEDDVDPNVKLSQSNVLKNASRTKEGYFVVKRII